MARRRSHIGHLRAPVVITLALGAVACDGDGDDDSVDCYGHRIRPNVSCNPPNYPPPWLTDADAGSHPPGAGGRDAGASADGAAGGDGSTEPDAGR